jgi:mono/diheme cytochrome c family protein
MRYLLSKHLPSGMALVCGMVLFCSMTARAQREYSGIGKAPTPEELQAANRGAGPSGKDLPPGKGNAKEGAQIFMVKCSMCHGRDGEGVNPKPGTFSHLRGPRLGGGTSVPLWPSPDAKPGITTMAFYVAYPSQIYNDISVAMPMFKPGSLTPNEVYALTAFVLYKNGIVKEDAVMDRETLPKVQMPNRHGMVPDNLEDIPNIEKRGCYKTYGVCP